MLSLSNHQSQQLFHHCEALLNSCRKQNVMIATAESCTGGLITAALTAIAGSSDVVDRGFVTYSNQAKHEQLQVPLDDILRNGATSENTARAMCLGALQQSRAQLSLSVTGIAGPGGGSEEKPIGLVYIASAFRAESKGPGSEGTQAKGNITVICRKQLFEGDRNNIRFETTVKALQLALENLQRSS